MTPDNQMLTKVINLTVRIYNTFNVAQHTIPLRHQRSHNIHQIALPHRNVLPRALHLAPQQPFDLALQAAVQDAVQLGDAHLDPAAHRHAARLVVVDQLRVVNSSTAACGTSVASNRNSLLIVICACGDEVRLHIYAQIHDNCATITIQYNSKLQHSSKCILQHNK